MLVDINVLLGNAKKIKENEKFKLYIQELDKQIEVNAIDRGLFLDIISGVLADRDAEVIYNSCQVFRDEKLIEKLGCTMNPVEVVGKVLSGASIYALAEKIIEKSGYSRNSSLISEIDDDIKN